MRTPGLSDASYMEFCREENPTPKLIEAVAALGGARSWIQVDRPCLERPGHEGPCRDIDGVRWILDSSGEAWYV